jgi:hypothetical protein
MAVVRIQDWPGLMSRKTALAYIDMGETAGAKVLDKIPSVCPPGAKERRWIRRTIDEYLLALVERD